MTICSLCDRAHRAENFGTNISQFSILADTSFSQITYSKHESRDVLGEQPLVANDNQDHLFR